MSKRKDHIDPSWIAWAKQQVELLCNGGYMGFQQAQCVFQINKTNKTLVLICAIPEFIGSELEQTNEEVFARVGYRYIRPDDVPTTADAALDRIFKNLHAYASNDLPTLIRLVGDTFRLNVDQYLKKVNRRIPINPVTIRGRNVLDTEPCCLSIGRLWIGSDTMPDAPQRFNPSQKRVQWEKPITLAIWKSEQDIANTKLMMVDEEDFIPAVKKLQETNDIVLKLWGRPSRHSPENWAVVFRRSPQNETMLVSFYPNGEEKENAHAALIFEKFIEGLGHLFPNGEL